MSSPVYPVVFTPEALEEQLIDFAVRIIALANRLAHGSSVPEMTLIDTRLVTARGAP